MAVVKTTSLEEYRAKIKEAYQALHKKNPHWSQEKIEYMIKQDIKPPIMDDGWSDR